MANGGLTPHPMLVGEDPDAWLLRKIFLCAASLHKRKVNYLGDLEIILLSFFLALFSASSPNRKFHGYKQNIDLIPIESATGVLTSCFSCTLPKPDLKPLFMPIYKLYTI